MGQVECRTNGDRKDLSFCRLAIGNYPGENEQRLDLRMIKNINRYMMETHLNLLYIYSTIP